MSRQSSSSSRIAPASAWQTRPHWNAERVSTKRSITTAYSLRHNSVLTEWGLSSVGRALPLQGRCQRFESASLQPHIIANLQPFGYPGTIAGLRIQWVEKFTKRHKDARIWALNLDPAHQSFQEKCIASLPAVGSGGSSVPAYTEAWAKNLNPNRFST